jgi:hypothetical protein
VISLEQVEAQLPAPAELLGGLHPLGHRLDPVPAAPGQGLGGLAGRSGQDVDLHVRREGDQRLGRGMPDEVVQGERVTTLGQAAGARHHLGVDRDGLQDLQHGLGGFERDRQGPGDERTGQVDQREPGADELVQAELGEGVEDDRGGGRVVVRHVRVPGVVGAAEQQLVRDQVAGPVVQGLPADVDLPLPAAARVGRGRAGHRVLAPLTKALSAGGGRP